MPRYVLLRHECPPEADKPSHWDFMLERDGALLTWSLLNLPDAWTRKADERSPSTSETPATRLPDHRLAYLDYEGPISGGRGVVRRVAHGRYTLLSEDETHLDVELVGKALI